MNGNQRWTENERQARALFDASVESLDAETRSRLNQARQAAVAEAERAQYSPWRTWLPAAAAASMALLAVVLWRMPADGVDPSARTTEPAPAAEVVELLATSEGLAVASEDPEFYAWLAAQDLPAANGAG